MPRKRVQRDPCDCLECRETFTADSSLGVAAAQQSPPPKCLVLSIDCTSNNSLRPLEALISNPSLPHIRGVVKDGCSSMLALRSSASLEGPGAPSAILQTTSALKSWCMVAISSMTYFCRADREERQKLAQLAQLFGTEKVSATYTVFHLGNCSGTARSEGKYCINTGKQLHSAAQARPRDVKGGKGDPNEPDSYLR